MPLLSVLLHSKRLVLPLVDFSGLRRMSSSHGFLCSLETSPWALARRRPGNRGHRFLVGKVDATGL